jgi:hypothetical protein
LSVNRNRRAFVPVAAVAASTVLAACHRSDSILLVEVAGDLALHPAELHVIVMAGTEARSLVVTPAPGKPIGLPASFSVELPPSLTGPVAISVDARDASGLVIAHGTAIQQNIDVGGQTVITVTLVSGALPGVDAGDADGGGLDAGGGTSGAGGAAGGGTGSGGTGGGGMGGGGMGGGGRGGAGGGGAGGGGMGGGGRGGGGGGGMGGGGRGGAGGGGAGGGGMGGGGRAGGGAGGGAVGVGGKAQDAGGDVALDLVGAFNAAEAT